MGRNKREEKKLEEKMETDHVWVLGVECVGMDSKQRRSKKKKKEKKWVGRLVCGSCSVCVSYELGSQKEEVYRE